jgi:simple sugar transport system permease protein
MAKASFGSQAAITDTLTEATPILLTGLAALIAFRIKVWNIGAEGQLLIGAVAAAGVAVLLPETTTPLVAIVAMIIAGIAAGGIYASLAAVPLATWKANEIVMTLMLNFIALAFVNFLIFGSNSVWRDDGFAAFPRGKLIPEVFRLPELSGRLNAGFLIAVAATIVFAWFMRFTTWGYEYSVVGDSRTTARYAGIGERRIVIGTFLLSGAAAGLAGAVLVSGTVGGLEPRSLAVGIGFSGILAAGLGRMSPLGLIPAAAFVSALASTGPDLQRIGVAPPITVALQGLVLVVVAAGQFFLDYRMVITSTSVQEPHTKEREPSTTPS